MPWTEQTIDFISRYGNPLYGQYVYGAVDPQDVDWSAAPQAATGWVESTAAPGTWTPQTGAAAEWSAAAPSSGTWV